MLKDTFAQPAAQPFTIWDAPNLKLDLSSLYDKNYLPKKRPEYTIKDGKLFDPVSGLYIDLELLIYKREDPTEKTFVLSAMDIALAKKDYPAVISMTDNILARDPKNVAAMCDKAVALSRQGKVEEALALNTKALAIKPDCAPLLNNRAIEYLKLGKPEEALRDIRKAIEIDKAKSTKPFIPSYGVMFTALYKTGQFKEALDVLEQGLNIKQPGVLVPMQLKSLAGCIGCSNPTQALEKIRQIRSEMSDAPQQAQAGPSESAPAPAPVPA